MSMVHPEDDMSTRHSFSQRILTVFTLISVLFLTGSATAGTGEISPVSVQCALIRDNELHIEINVNRISHQSVVDQDGTRDLFYFENEGVLEVEGKPVLPYIAKSILIPREGECRLHQGDVGYRIESGYTPVLARAATGDNLPQQVECDGEDSEFWPNQPVVAGETAILRGYRLLNFRVYPVQFNSKTGEMKFNEHVEFHFTFDSGNLDPEPRYASQYAWRAVRSLVLNPPEEPGRDDLLSASYLYIIPSFNGIEEVMDPLLEWRRRQGHNVRVEYVRNNAPRNDIQDIINDAYDSPNPVEFVALVGDADESGDFRLPANNFTSDYPYATIDGNDALPDVAIGRISCEDLDELERIVNKLVSYEAAPYMDDTDWFLQGAVIAGHRGNGLGTVLVAKYVRKELLSAGFNEVRYWYHTIHGEIGGDQPFVSDAFNWGISVMQYRAYQYMNRLPLNVIEGLNNRRGRWPAVITISCNTGDFTTTDGQSEAFLRARGGGIGAIGTATPGTSVQYNNIMSGGYIKGIYKDQLYTFGWGLNMGKYELWRSYQGFDDRYLDFMEWNNLMGDPGTHIWTGIPHQVEVDHLQEIAVGSSYLNVQVFDPESEIGEADALICLYKEGDIHAKVYTDENGRAQFNFPHDALSEGVMFITATKHNMHPYLGQIGIVSDDNFIGASGLEIDDDDEGASNGNGNRAANPGETLELNIEITNFGDEAPGGAITVRMLDDSPWFDVRDAEVRFDAAPGAGEVVNALFVIEVDPACPDRMDLPLHIEVQSEDGEWSSMLTTAVEAPDIIVNQVRFGNGELRPGDIHDLDIQLANIGMYNLAPATVELASGNEIIELQRNTADYDRIDMDETGWIEGDPFRIAVNNFAVPGMTVEMTLLLETEGGFRDTTAFNLTLIEPGASDPFGPDEYGYYCFDSGDEDWQMAPVYEWIEIDPAQEGEFEGVTLDLDDGGDNQDESVMVNLPFDFQYYGEVFDQITVCSNGWAAFGDQQELAAFRNRHIGQALGPNAQLCAWWDNLVTTNGAVLVYHDEQSDRYIIEWSNVQRLVEGGNGARETFEIILYDPNSYPTYTGDGIITFQYKEVTNQNRHARNDTPFCTIGISNLDGSGGLEYTYWNQYPPGAKEINSEMAITFTTASSFITGVIQGTVTDEATGVPIENAAVATRSVRTLTDVDGFYRLDLLICDDYEITVSSEGYNDSTRMGDGIAEDDTLIEDFRLLYSEFHASVGRIAEVLNSGESTEVGFNISNSGNGALRWSAARIFEEGEAGLGRRLQSHFVGPAVQDLSLEGVAFVDNMIFVTGQNGQNPNQIYVFDIEGNHHRSFQQVGDARIGMLDLTWGDGLIWGSGERMIFGFNTNGDLMRSFVGPNSNNRALAYDPDREAMWTFSSRSNTIIAVDMDGLWVTAINSRRLSITGMAYWQDDPDGFNLYLLHQPEQDQMLVHKANPETGDTMFVASVSTDEIGQAGGAFLAEDYGRYGNVFMVLVNDYLNHLGDRVDIWQVGTYSGWMTLDHDEGVVPPESRQDLVLTLDASGLLPYNYGGTIEFAHTAAGHTAVIEVELEVNELDVTETEFQPAEFSLSPAYPNPFNASTLLKYRVPAAGRVRLSVYDLNGREVALLTDDYRPAGSYAIEVNSSGWSSGTYFIRLQSGGRQMVKKLVSLK